MSDFNEIKARIINNSDIKKIVEHLKLEGNVFQNFKDKILIELQSVKAEENRHFNNYEDELKKV